MLCKQDLVDSLAYLYIEEWMESFETWFRTSLTRLKSCVSSLIYLDQLKNMQVIENQDFFLPCPCLK